MPLPDDAVTVTGGCSCGAIRYRVAIPPLKERPHHPISLPTPIARVPQTMTCHCNDCRRATGSFLSPGFMDIPGSMLTVSAVPPSSESTIACGRILDVSADDYDQQRADAERPPYLPASDVIIAAQESSTWVRFYHGVDCGPEWSRSFCGRCGSQLFFHFKLKAEYCRDDSLPKDITDMFHITLGSMDRKFLEVDWFIPDLEFNLKYATPFSKQVSETATGLKDVHKLDQF